MVFRLCASLFLLLSASGMSSALTQSTASATPDSLQARGPSHSGPSVAFSIVKVAGDEVCFTLTAKDRDGNVIADWNTRSEATTLTLLNSTANTDSSARPWNADRKGYTWAAMSSNGQPLAQAAPHEWLLPAAAFDSLGKARICLVDSKAESGVEILVGPAVVYLNQRTDKISFIAGPAADYLVEVTAQVPDRQAVYHERPYEVVVTPRDRYTNTASETVPTRLLARWPDEMDEALPDVNTVFSRDVIVAGPTSFIIASRFVRELPKDAAQFVIAHKSGDFSISGRSNDFEIRSHPPYPFKLLSPMNHRYIRFYPGVPSQFEVFSWEKPYPPDAFTDIPISRFDKRTGNDTLRYTLTFVDSLTLTRSMRYVSDNSGMSARCTMSHPELGKLIEQLSQQRTILWFNVVWYVEASDGLSTTASSPSINDPQLRPGFYACLYQLHGTAVSTIAAPSGLFLYQNFPNPFNPLTSLGFSIPAAGHVTLRIFDILGALVATPVNELLVGGTYHATFDASQLPSGTYVYTLQFGDQLLTRRMTVMK